MRPVVGLSFLITCSYRCPCIKERRESEQQVYHSPAILLFSAIQYDGRAAPRNSLGNRHQWAVQDRFGLHRSSRDSGVEDSSLQYLAKAPGDSIAYRPSTIVTLLAELARGQVQPYRNKWHFVRDPRLRPWPLVLRFVLLVAYNVADERPAAFQTVRFESCFF